MTQQIKPVVLQGIVSYGAFKKTVYQKIKSLASNNTMSKFQQYFPKVMYALKQQSGRHYLQYSNLNNPSKKTRILITNPEQINKCIQIIEYGFTLGHQFNQAVQQVMEEESKKEYQYDFLSYDKLFKGYIQKILKDQQPPSSINSKNFLQQKLGFQQYLIQNVSPQITTKMMLQKQLNTSTFFYYCQNMLNSWIDSLNYKSTQQIKAIKGLLANAGNNRMKIKEQLQQKIQNVPKNKNKNLSMQATVYKKFMDMMLKKDPTRLNVGQTMTKDKKIMMQKYQKKIQQRKAKQRQTKYKQIEILIQKQKEMIQKEMISSKENLNKMIKQKEIIQKKIMQMQNQAMQKSIQNEVMQKSKQNEARQISKQNEARQISKQNEAMQIQKQNEVFQKQKQSSEKQMDIQNQNESLQDQRKDQNEQKQKQKSINQQLKSSSIQQKIDKILMSQHHSRLTFDVIDLFFASLDQMQIQYDDFKTQLTMQITDCMANDDIQIQSDKIEEISQQELRDLIQQNNFNLVSQLMLAIFKVNKVSKFQKLQRTIKSFQNHLQQNNLPLSFQETRMSRIVTKIQDKLTKYEEQSQVQQLKKIQLQGLSHIEKVMEPYVDMLQGNVNQQLKKDIKQIKQQVQNVQVKIEQQQTFVQAINQMSPIKIEVQQPRQSKWTHNKQHTSVIIDALTQFSSKLSDNSAQNSMLIELIIEYFQTLQTKLQQFSLVTTYYEQIVKDLEIQNTNLKKNCKNISEA